MSSDGLAYRFETAAQQALCLVMGRMSSCFDQTRPGATFAAPTAVWSGALVSGSGTGGGVTFMFTISAGSEPELQRLLDLITTMSTEATTKGTGLLGSAVVADVTKDLSELRTSTGQTYGLDPSDEVCVCVFFF